MSVNPKKQIKLLNRTNYFDPEITKTYVHFGSPNSYQSRKAKIEGYENRLYWEYRYCDENNGQTFFYTLTYNDRAIPKFEGQNCFDYNDLVYLLNGGFKKKLLRKYGTNFKYFVGAELGDGKGERGMHNNPHYHVLFFLRPANDDRYPYIKINPKDFRTLVKTYWQGFDENVDGKHDYRLAKFGIAREGQNIGLVKDFRACMYCAKYVSKDVALKEHERKIESRLTKRFTDEVKEDKATKDLFWKMHINYLFNTSTRSHLYLKPEDYLHEDWVYSPLELLHIIAPNLWKERFSGGQLELFETYSSDIVDYVDGVIAECGLEKDYSDFCDKLVEDKVRLAINEYRNRYCNKCRISQGVGDYALSHIEDLMHPRIQIPKKKGWKNRPIGMYYYRKLYTEVVKDAENQPIRILNELGIKYKLSRLPEQIDEMVKKQKTNVSLLTRDLFDEMRSSDINTDTNMTFDEFKGVYIDNANEILKRYAEYKLVYEDRYFQISPDGHNCDSAFPYINCSGDYERFLQPIVGKVDYNPCRLSCFVKKPYNGYLSYYAHPYFLRYSRVFGVLDLVSDYFFIKADDKNQKQAEQIAETQRFHNKIKVQEFYKNFM